MIQHDELDIELDAVLMYLSQDTATLASMWGDNPFNETPIRNALDPNFEARLMQDIRTHTNSDTPNYFHAIDDVYYEQLKTLYLQPGESKLLALLNQNQHVGIIHHFKTGFDALSLFTAPNSPYGTPGMHMVIAKKLINDCFDVMSAHQTETTGATYTLMTDIKKELVYISAFFYVVNKIVVDCLLTEKYQLMTASKS